MNSALKILSVCAVAATAAAAAGGETYARSEIYAIAKPSYDAVLTFPISGTVDEVLVKDGDRVTKGQLLARLDDSVENAQLEQLKAKAESTIEVDAAAARLEQSKSDLKKIEEAAKKGAASPREVEHARLDVKIGELSLKLAEFEHGQNARKYEQMKRQIDRMRLQSVVRGIVESVLVEKGETVTIQENEVARILIIDPLRVDAPVPLGLARTLKIGGRATISFLDREVRLKGRIIYVSPLAEAASNTVRVRIETPNPDHYKAGQQVRVSFPGVAGKPAGVNTGTERKRDPLFAENP